jgi:hypothetical protein
MSGPLDIAREAWGRDLPTWVETLAIECGKASQTKVAAKLDRSTAMISQVLRRKYPGDLVALEQRVRGVFEDAVIQCPALGTMPVHVCQDWQGKAAQFQTGNPLRVRMYRACHRCPRIRKEAKDDQKQAG